jgi:hypothetical protein
MKKLIVITTFVLVGTLANLAQATLFTGCISPGGDLKNVAVGEEPAKQCGRNDTLIHWEEAAVLPQSSRFLPAPYLSLERHSSSKIVNQHFSTGEELL